jgi:hypothetical protein
LSTTFSKLQIKIEKEDEFLYLQENLCDELGNAASTRQHKLQATLHDKTNRILHHHLQTVSTKNQQMVKIMLSLLCENKAQHPEDWSKINKRIQ